MEIKGEAKLLRIFVGEADRYEHETVFERIVLEARKRNLAGATVTKGVMGFGASSRIHTAKILRLSEDMPLIIEIADETEKIDAFIPFVKELFAKARSGGLITAEKVEIIRYTGNSAD